jgi:hypothetical protein
MEDVFPIVTTTKFNSATNPSERERERERERKNEFAKLVLEPTSIDATILAQWAYITLNCV